MIIIVGSTGYIGTAFVDECVRRKLEFIGIRHTECVRDMTLPDNCDLLVNCAAYIPKESVALCDREPQKTCDGNLFFPEMLSQICERHKVPFAHISTACLWSDGKMHTEDDPPQRIFAGHCGFYIGIKHLAERAVAINPKHYIWRIRLPFDEIDYSRNYLTKLTTLPEVWTIRNTIVHRRDFAKACLDLYEKHAPYGTYNVLNHGAVSADLIVKLLMKKGICTEPPVFSTGLVGDCLVSSQKLEKAGVHIRLVMEALMDAINNWKPIYQCTKTTIPAVLVET